MLGEREQIVGMPTQSAASGSCRWRHPGSAFPQFVPSPPESPKGRAIRGERRRIGRNADPGRREGSCPSLALGYFLVPFQGSRKKQQSPAAALLEKTSNLQKRALSARSTMVERALLRTLFVWKRQLSISSQLQEEKAKVIS